MRVECHELTTIRCGFLVVYDQSLGVDGLKVCLGRLSSKKSKISKGKALQCLTCAELRSHVSKGRHIAIRYSAELANKIASSDFTNRQQQYTTCVHEHVRRSHSATIVSEKFTHPPFDCRLALCQAVDTKLTAHQRAVGEVCLSVEDSTVQRRSCLT